MGDAVLELAARGDEREESRARRSARTPARARRLLLCLDGVPYDVVREAKSRGLFENFRDPSRLLSPFPTLTNVALAEMLGASPPQGYESLYFDREARELRGGVRKYLGRRTPDKVPSSYMDELDYQEPLPFEFLIYVATERVWRADMRRFRERFLKASPDRDFFGFLKATDGLLHIGGPKRLGAALESLDRLLRGLHDECGSETEFLLFSDHGMNLVENRRVHLQTHLRRCGYETVSGMRRFRGRRRVSSPAFGLCGYVALYCGDETQRGELAEALRELEGVDFSLHREDGDSEGTVFVSGRRGRARIRKETRDTSGAYYLYETIDGDPLELNGAAAKMKGANLLDARGYASDRDWLAHTSGHVYPDALSNLHASLFEERVRHTADVLVSLSDGYYYGASSFSRLVRLLATHGNALAPSTNAFMMSTHREFPSHVRSSDARPFLRG